MPINIDDYEIVKATEGSPYREVQGISDGIMEVNPYFRLTDIIEAFYEDEDFFNTDEGRLLFDIAVKTINDIDTSKDYRLLQFEKRLVALEIGGGCFGERVTKIWNKLEAEDRDEVLANLLSFYKSREKLQPFINLIQKFIPESMVFRKRTRKTELFVYAGYSSSMELEDKYYLAKSILLPIGYSCYIAWDKPFLITDIDGLHHEGSKII